jgi:hypothetical protein
VDTTLSVPLVTAVRETFLDGDFFGVIALTQAMLPLLQKSEAGRIVERVEYSRLAPPLPRYARFAHRSMARRRSPITCRRRR